MKNKMKFNHDIGTIEALLRSIRPFPGEGLQQRMDLAPWRVNDERDLAQLRVKRLIKLASIAAGATLLIGLAFSPVGRVLAEEIVQFFNYIIGNTLPLPSDQILEPVPTATPQPTYYPALLPADQVALPEETALTAPEAASQMDPAQLQNLDIMSARALVDFPLLEPAYLPQEYRIQNIRFDDKRQMLSMTYSPDVSTEGIKMVLSERHNPFDIEFPEDAKQETIGVAGKTVECYDRVKQPLPDGADEIMLWQQNGVSLKMAVHYGEEERDTAYSHEDWFAVIEGLTTCPVSGNTKDYACEVNRAAVAVGFVPSQFQQTPEGYSFKSVNYDPDKVAIWYAGSTGELGLLQSTQDFKTQETSDWFSVPADAIQEVIVAGQIAEYVEGEFVVQPGQDHAVWNPDSGYVRLRWKQSDWWLQLVKWGSPQMQPQELADLAADLVTDSTRVNAEQQSSHESEMVGDAYLTLADAENAYGKQFMRPGILPEDLPFSHARLSDKNALMLFYGAFAENKQQAISDGLIFIQGDIDISFEEMYKDYPPGAIMDVQVNGLPAKLISGTMRIGWFDADGQSLGGPQWVQEPFMLSLYWESDDCYYILRFFTISGSSTRMDASDLIEIGESLHK